MTKQSSIFAEMLLNFDDVVVKPPLGKLNEVFQVNICIVSDSMSALFKEPLCL